MKKFYIALLFAVSTLSMQTASAATLTLSNLAGGVVGIGSGATVGGSSNETLPLSVWNVGISGLGASGLADLDFNIIFNGLSGFKAVFEGGKTTGLTAGNYILTIVTVPLSLIHYDFTIGATDVPVSGNVPVPAAVWLFGSALLGLVGMGRRKSQPGLAA